MKVNLGVELSDDQRRALASRIAGKEVKRLASRDDVRAYVDGCVAGLTIACDDAPAPAVERMNARAVGADVGQQRSRYRPEEAAEVARLTALGKHPDYIWGWIATGRALQKDGKPPAYIRNAA